MTDHETKTVKAIHAVDRLIIKSEEYVRTLKALRVSLLMELYPKMDWLRDRYSVNHVDARFTAMMAAGKFKREHIQAAGGKQ